jgi:hypothetical protein
MGDTAQVRKELNEFLDLLQGSTPSGEGMGGNSIRCPLFSPYKALVSRNRENLTISVVDPRHSSHMGQDVNLMLELVTVRSQLVLDHCPILKSNKNIPAVDMETRGLTWHILTDRWPVLPAVPLQPYLYCPVKAYGSN